MGILDYLIIEEKWLLFYNEKNDKHHFTKTEAKEITDFIQTKTYLSYGKRIINNDYDFSIPQKKMINKSATKKRTVYSFTKEEMIILKFITFYLDEYSFLFSQNLFSFQKNKSPKKAWDYIKGKVKDKYYYKLDICNYFNDIDLDILFTILDKKVDDEALNLMVKKLLIKETVSYKETLQTEKHGVMAGVPLSSFLANLYLSEMDHYFYNSTLIYLRYSDDIIIFGKKEEIEQAKEDIFKTLQAYKLTINPEKETQGIVNDGFEFLGFSYYQDSDKYIIDISKHAKMKLKAKIKRKARAMYRWRIKKNVSSEKAIKVMIDVFNKKFFSEQSDERTWSRWYFPIITTTKSLNEIDQYFQDNLRYLVSGRYCKKNYKEADYELLKTLGYQTLVNAYFKFLNYNDGGKL